MTSQELQMSLFEESDVWMLSEEDFRARLSALLESEQDLRILEGLYSLRLLGSHLFSDLNIYYLRTSQDCSTMTTEIHSRPSSERWMIWGMMRNGKCSTARILESPKTESGCILSDILEEQVDERYFLSEEMTQRLILNNQK
ncbi:methyl transferase [Streptococcus suis]|nr:methyl transferase [Streptococcus suis]